MSQKHRREFLADVGQGMLVASIGTALASDLGLAPAMAAESGSQLTFGQMEPMVEAKTFPSEFVGRFLFLDHPKRHYHFPDFVNRTDSVAHHDVRATILEQPSMFIGQWNNQFP